MPDKVTSLDVAQRAGVSRSAVSRVFTPGASVSAATKEKVREAAEVLGYRPNALARSLLTGRSRMIGLVVGYLDNHFYPVLVERLSQMLEAEGFHILMFLAEDAEANLDQVVTDLLDYQVDGLVLASVTLGSTLGDRCAEMNVPVVELNRSDGGQACHVVSDNYAGGQMAVAHLLAQGRRRIGHIAGFEGASTQRAREAGALAALRGAGLAFVAREVGNFDAAAARDAARQMFQSTAKSLDNRPDAVFVANDFMAFHVLDVLRYECGLSVPQDVAVIGFDDVPTSSFAAFDLTTVRQDLEGMVAYTVDVLMGRQTKSRVLAPQLIVRKTCGAGSSAAG
ncbi:MAG: LacI family DNA-binding transcriptional regulator [Pseudomonadota bacterium]